MNDNEKKQIFPQISKALNDFIEDEDGNITRSRLAVIGSMIMLMSIMYGMEALADHSSHRSHRSHSSHQSGSGGHGSHESHVSHQSHTSSSTHDSHSSHSDHGSHSSHTSHSNTSSHSNSRFSNEGDVTYGPSLSSIKGISSQPAAMSVEELTTPGFKSALIGEHAISDIVIPTISTLPVPPSTPQIQDILPVDFYTEETDSE